MKNITKHSVFILVKPITTLLTTTILICFLLIGCKKESAPVQTQANAQSVDQLTAKWGTPDIIVHQGESIQAAIDKADHDMVILIEPGTYNEDIVVDKAGIKLIGKRSADGDVIINNPGDEEYGISVTDNGDNFVLANVTVQNFSEYGVYLDSVDNYIISYVNAVNNKEYGIFPSHSNHGLIDHCSATGSSDTGIYVGQSSDVEMQYNTAYANVNGLEVENSSDVDVSFNHAYNNVDGIIVDVLPGKDIKTCYNVRVRSNLLNQNNHENFGDTDQLESSVPSGVGIIVLGADQVKVEDNVITGNEFAGVAVFSTLVLSVLADVPPEEILGDIEPNPDGVKVARNVLHHNGYNPPIIPDLPLPGVDLLWDGSGTDNCWSNNVFRTSSPSPLPSCN